MENIVGKDRRNLQDLFADVPIWKAFIHSAIEDGFGIMKADNKTSPTAAVLFYNGLVIYAGNPDKKNSR